MFSRRTGAPEQRAHNDVARAAYPTGVHPQ